MFSYGQKITVPMRKVNRILGIGFTSSSDPTDSVQCTIERYWESDQNPDTYKVRVVPISEEDKVKYGKGDSFYSTDLRSLIQQSPKEYVLEPSSIKIGLDDEGQWIKEE